MATRPLLRLLASLLVVLLAVHHGFAQQTFSVQPDATYSEFVGNSVVLRCSIANKEGALSWVMDGTNAISSDRQILDTTQTRFTILGDDASGSFNLQITSLQESDSGTYQCRVTANGNSNEIVSNDAVLTVSPIPIQTFTTEPAAVEAITERMATLSCVVEDKEGNLEWLKDGSVISNNTEITDGSLTRYSITGDAANGEFNLQIINVVMSDAGTYKCRVSAAGNSAAIESGDAVLTVRDASEVQSIRLPPSDVTATVGTSATMVCFVSALSGTVAWLKNGIPITSNREFVNGDTSGRVSVIGDDDDGEYHLYFSEIEDADQGTYYCILTSSNTDAGVSSSPATLTVLPAQAPSDSSPECSITPSSDLRENDVVTLKCESTGGTPQPTLTWSNDLDANAYAGNQTEYSAHTTNILTLKLTNDLSGVAFSCRSTHPAYSSPQECDLEPLTFQLIATINVTVSSNRLTIEESKPGEVVCQANGNPQILEYMWYYNGAIIGNTDDRFVVSTTSAKDSSTLSIISATLSMDQSTVECVARNRIDERRSSVILTIKEDNLTTYVLAALGLIAVFIFVAIVIGFIIWVVYRMKQKQKVYPIIDIEANGMPKTNMLIGANHMTPGGLPNGELKTEKEDKKKHKKHKKHKKDKKDRKHKKDRKDKSKVIEHDSSRAPDPLSTRDGDHAVLPTITGYRRPGPGLDPGFYPTYPAAGPAMQPLDGHSPLPHYHEGYGQGVPNGVVNTSQDGGPAAKISLSPGEYQAREEYDRRMRELQGLRKNLVPEEEEKKKKKKHHKKHKKEKSKDKNSSP